MKATCLPVSGYSADTEILTRRQGWVTFDQLTCFDEVATRSPEGLFTWQRPEHVGWQRYDGEMVWLHSRTLDLQVMPSHKILHMERVRYMRGGVTRTYPSIEAVSAAADLVGQKPSLVGTSRWEPPEPRDRFTLIATRVKNRIGRPPSNFTATADDFAAFLGMYLAEGNLSADRDPKHDVWIWQKAGGRGFAEYQDLIDRVVGRHVPHMAKAACWHFQNKALYTFLKGCGEYAWGKFIPAEILELAPASLEKFWEYYSLGDGTTMNSYSSGVGRKHLDVISTTSRTMAGQLQEVLQKLGGWGLIQCIDNSKYPTKLGATSRLGYRIVRRAGTQAFASTIEAVPYAGMLGSIQADGPVYVRRRYRPVWSGA